MVDARGAAAPAESAASAAPAAPPHPAHASDLRGVCDAAGGGLAVRQLSYIQNMDFTAGAGLPLRLPSGSGAGGRRPRAPSRAFLEAGTTLGQEAKRWVA
jgi:hypothetical protein